ncbi:hypothetical protein K458DRAFT_15448 [Lentithecium fluviatile CBS 122367]|uniref:Uncharacterized protein n=1 Tax=Lentithecium fluviatile CBS 122367 TaxID=1168545 RepID=A0A6G1J627_9PLEO|nr:hypothetical protein K458DRAFT_15448 [Lentithecium fluviatile CBS 122367]
MALYAAQFLPHPHFPSMQARCSTRNIHGATIFSPSLSKHISTAITSFSPSTTSSVLVQPLTTLPTPTAPNSPQQGTQPHPMRPPYITPGVRTSCLA